MNTLTNFIDAQLSLSVETSSKESNSINEVNASGLYEIIENEELRSCFFNNLTISGSLFSLSTFTDVTFESCVFYASRFENCTFINCNFINCKFEFSELQHSRFNKCNWEESFFSFSPFKKCSLAFCNLDYKFKATFNEEENELYNCNELTPLTWEDVLEVESKLPPQSLPKQSGHQESNNEEGNWFIALQEIFQKIKAA